MRPRDADTDADADTAVDGSAAIGSSRRTE